jgi:DNA repair ATPase RecN
MSSSKDTGSRGTLPGLKILNVEDILFTTVEAICQDSLLQILNNDQSSINYAIDRICELVTDSFSASKAEALLMMEEKIKNLYGTIHEFRKQVYDLKDQNSNYRKGIENLNQEVSKSQAIIRQLQQ